MKKTIRILVGIPCAGKSTYSESIKSSNKFYMKIISRDKIREEFYKKENFNNFGRYIFNYKDEDIITEKYNKELENSYYYDLLILDNTHCKEKYIDDVIYKYSETHNIEVKFFDINLYKAHYRNIIRKFKSNKWIPMKVINTMYRNYNKINKKKYEQYKC